jgi:hypothetical protein
MTEDSNSNDDNGAGQIAMTDDMFGWPGDGVHWAWQRCGRYKYRKVLMHSTNPGHLGPDQPSLTDIPPLQVVRRYRRDDGFTIAQVATMIDMRRR